MVLCCISLMISNTEHHFMYLLAIWENVCLDPLPIFKFLFFFSCLVWFLYIFWVVVVALSLSCVWLFCAPMDCSPPGSFVHGISWAGILEWVAISFSRGSTWPNGSNPSSAAWATSEAHISPLSYIWFAGLLFFCFFFFHFIGCLFFLLMALSIS